MVLLDGISSLSVKVIYSPITSALGTVYTTHQQQQEEAQRLCQREYHGRQAAKKWEQQNRDLYLVAILKSFICWHESAFSCPCVQVSLVLSTRCAQSVCSMYMYMTPYVCLLQPINSSCFIALSLRSMHTLLTVCSIMCWIDCICLTQAHLTLSCIPLVIETFVSTVVWRDA